jgi:diphthamide synthase subunit DPH2
MGRKSISQRLSNAKELQTKQEIALDWSANWQQEQAKLIMRLEHAIKTDDYDELCIVTGELKAVTLKRFEALPNVIKLLTLDEQNND